MFTLLTKCGVVVGVFGLGPKGRGLDSLHCMGYPYASEGARIKFTNCNRENGCPIGYPYGCPCGVPIEAHEVWPMGAHGATPKTKKRKIVRNVGTPSGAGNLGQKSHPHKMAYIAIILAKNPLGLSPLGEPFHVL